VFINILVSKEKYKIFLTSHSIENVPQVYTKFNKLLLTYFNISYFDFPTAESPNKISLISAGGKSFAS
jgi:hypothetical protein